MSSNDRYSFRDRWRMEGTLETLSPLHIGDGGELHYLQRDNPGCPLTAAQIKDGPFVATVAVDANNRAYLPGSSLKGCLRSWIGASADDAFGGERQGGVAEFLDAFAEDVPSSFSPGRQWNPQRLTSIANRVAINRRLRTASHRKLFQLEFVPPGVRFRVTICGAGLTPLQVGQLLATLQATANPQRPLVFGAGTASGFGRMKWQCSAIRRLTRDSAVNWLREGHRGYENLPLLPTVAWPQPQPTPHPGSEVLLQVTLRFQSPFLVKDGDPALTGGENQPAFLPLRNATAGPYLPATSFRGALRSQFERIARTIGLPAGYPDRQSYLDDLTIANQQELPERLNKCLASQLFGAPGWRAPLEVSDFTPAPDCHAVLKPQEFVAIDRFTGGGANELKYHGSAWHSAVLSGTLRISTERLRLLPHREKALEVLSYTLRDLAEGDIPLGFGATKGYGAVLADIRIISGTIDGLPLDWKGSHHA